MAEVLNDTIILLTNLKERILITLEPGMDLRRKEVRLLTLDNINLSTMQAHYSGKRENGGGYLRS